MAKGYIVRNNTFIENPSKRGTGLRVVYGLGVEQEKKNFNHHMRESEADTQEQPLHMIKRILPVMFDEKPSVFVERR